MENKKEEKIGQALLKVALGYQLAEVTEEYAEVDGALKLTKRKKTKKDVAPDLKAVQMLLENGGAEEYSAWSQEDLEREKTRLLALLQESMQDKTAGDGSQASENAGGESGAKKAAVKKSVVKKTVRKTSVKKSAVKKTAVKKKTTK